MIYKKIPLHAGGMQGASRYFMSGAIMALRSICLSMKARGAYDRKVRGEEKAQRYLSHSQTTAINRQSIVRAKYKAAHLRRRVSLLYKYLGFGMRHRMTPVMINATAKGVTGAIEGMHTSVQWVGSGMPWGWVFMSCLCWLVFAPVSGAEEDGIVRSYNTTLSYTCQQ